MSRLIRTGSVFKSSRTPITPLLKLGCLACLFLHFSLAAIFTLPNTPLQFSSIGDLAQVYIGRYFSQRWSFFAPRPGDTTETLLVVCAHRDDHASSDKIATEATMPVPATGWEDITTPLIVAAQRNLLSGYETLSRPQVLLMRDFLSGGTKAAEADALCLRGVHESCQQADNELHAVRQRNGLKLAHIAGLFCLDRYGPRFWSVALKIRTTVPVPWSERYSNAVAFKELPIGVFAIDTPATPPQVYSRINGGRE